MSAGDRKNWMFADCATITANNTRMIVARMRSRLDTDQPFFSVVVVDLMVVEVVEVTGQFDAGMQRCVAA